MDVTAENLDREWDVAAGPNVGGRGVTREHPPALQKCREHLPPQHCVLPSTESTHCSAKAPALDGAGDRQGSTLL